MKNILILLICLFAVFTSQAQRVNKNGKKMVSKVTCVWSMEDDTPLDWLNCEIRYHYNEKCELIGMEKSYTENDGNHFVEKYRKDENENVINGAIYMNGKKFQEVEF